MRRVVVARRIARQRPALHFHLVRGLPGARDHFADAPHGLRIARHHADDAEIVQDVFGRDGLLPDAAFGERDVFGNLWIQMMADHQHVQMLGDGVHRQRPRGVGRRRKNIGKPAILMMSGAWPPPAPSV